MPLRFWKKNSTQSLPWTSQRVLKLQVRDIPMLSIEERQLLLQTTITLLRENKHICAFLKKRTNKRANQITAHHSQDMQNRLKKYHPSPEDLSDKWLQAIYTAIIKTDKTTITQLCQHPQADEWIRNAYFQNIRIPGRKRPYSILTIAEYCQQQFQQVFDILQETISQESSSISYRLTDIASHTDITPDDNSSSSSFVTPPTALPNHSGTTKNRTYPKNSSSPQITTSQTRKNSTLVTHEASDQFRTVQQPSDTLLLEQLKLMLLSDHRKALKEQNKLFKTIEENTTLFLRKYTTINHSTQEYITCWVDPNFPENPKRSIYYITDLQSQKTTVRYGKDCNALITIKANTDTREGMTLFDIQNGQHRQYGRQPDDVFIEISSYKYTDLIHYQSSREHAPTY